MGLGSSKSSGHQGGRDFEQDELFGADPSLVGLPRPVGWIVRLPDGTAAWIKTGPLDTDWTPITGAALAGVTQIVAGTGIGVSPGGGTGVVTVTNNGVLTLTAGTNVTLAGTAQNPIVNATVPAAGVTSVVAGDGITITNPTGPAVTVGQVVAASWVVDRTRVYAVDGVNGNDANVGFVDMAGTTAGDYATAKAAAGLVAKKTVAGIAAIWPRVGNGRKVEVAFAAGTYAGSPADFLNGTSGYAAGCPLISGTGTNATAGSVAFAGTAAEVAYLGAVTATGLFATGYTPAGSISTSSIQCTQVGGGAPAFGAEPALPLGLRIRFDVATTTAALRNISRQVGRVPASDIVQLQTVEPALPVAGDTFYAEQPGVIFSGACNLDAPITTGAVFAGIAFALDVTFTTGRWRLAFCTGNNWTSSTNDLITTAQTYTHPVLGTVTCGGGYRLGGAAIISRGQLAFAGFVAVQGQTMSNPATSSTWGAGCAARNLICLNWPAAQNDSTAQSPNIGVPAATSVGIPHTFGPSGVRIDGCLGISLGNLDIVGAGATPALQFAGKSSVVMKGTVTGSTGNTDIGADFQNATLTTVELRAGQLPTVTGTAGNIRFANQSIAPWTNLNFEEIYDQAANRVFEGNTNGAAYAYTIDPSVVNGVYVDVANATSYQVVRSNGTNLQVTRAQADTAAHASGLAGVLLIPGGNGATTLYGGMSGYKACQFDAAPVVGAIAYLSVGTPGNLTTTVPPLSLTNQKLRVGVVVGNAFPGNIGVVRMNPELLPVLADGLP